VPGVGLAIDRGQAQPAGRLAGLGQSGRLGDREAGCQGDREDDADCVSVVHAAMDLQPRCHGKTVTIPDISARACLLPHSRVCALTRALEVAPVRRR
jgi:hypothetical protein